MKKLYEILGISETATQEEIKNAFRKKAKECHPDLMNGDTEKMKEINKAYAILKDPAKREHYDRTGEEKDVDDTIDVLIIIALELTELLIKDNPNNVNKWLDKKKENSRKNFEETLKNLEKDRDKYKKFLNRILKKPDKDFVGDTVKTKIANKEFTIKKLKEEYDLRKEVFTLFKEYKFKEEKEDEFYNFSIRFEDIVGRHL